MTQTSHAAAARPRQSAAQWMRHSGAAWFTVAAGSQFLFGLYVVALYGVATLAGDLFERASFMPVGFKPGDAANNIQLGLHLAAAAFLSCVGAWQLVPQVRARVPALHRLVGRIYLPLAVLAGVGGAVLIWTRERPASLEADISITLNGLAIALCALLAWRAAVQRRFADHQAWATRLFLMVSGVWFLRVGLMAWVAINGGEPVGIGNLDGWFYNLWNYGSWIVPLAVYEAWRAAGRATTPGPKLAMAAGMAVATALTLVGSVLAVIGMWLPRLI